jgi:hypothetical protein
MSEMSTNETPDSTICHPVMESPVTVSRPITHNWSQIAVMQGTGAVAHLVGSICQAVSESGGVVGLDVCGYNEQALRLPTALLRLGRTFSPGVSHQRVDTQTYWAYEFPTPA